jgi:hypothetical protein
VVALKGSDGVLEQHFAPADALREEPALLHLVLPLLVDLGGERLRADLLSMPAAVLVVVDGPPGAAALAPASAAAGGLVPLEDAALPALTFRGVVVRVAHVVLPRRSARTLGPRARER